jgi:hypothetical protein
VFIALLLICFSLTSYTTLKFRIVIEFCDWWYTNSASYLISTYLFIEKGGVAQRQLLKIHWRKGRLLSNRLGSRRMPVTTRLYEYMERGVGNAGTRRLETWILTKWRRATAQKRYGESLKNLFMFKLCIGRYSLTQHILQCDDKATCFDIVRPFFIITWKIIAKYFCSLGIPVLHTVWVQ